MLSDFEYCAPETIDELHETLDKYGENAEIIAGGTDLLVDIRNEVKSPEIIIDIKKIDNLGGINFDSSDGLTIGARATCGELIKNTEVRENYSYLVEAALDLGSRQVRNRATVVGNLCNASPCGDMSRALACAEAEAIITSSDGRRTISLPELFTGVKQTSLADNELLEAVRVPSRMANIPGGNKKLKRIKGHDLALASVTMLKKKDYFNVTIGACGTTPVTLDDIDINIAKDQLHERVEEAIAPIDDQRASKEYRTFMVKTYVSRLKDELS